MKFLLFIFILLSINSFSQEKNNKKIPKNEIKLSLTGFIDNTFTLGYERKFKNNTSIVVNQGIKYNVYNLGNYSELQYRLYLYPKHKNNKFVKIDAFYMSLPYIFYKYNDEKTSRINDNTHYFYESYGAGILTGVKFSFGDNIIFDFNFGTGYINTKTPKGYYNIYHLDYYQGYTYKRIEPVGKILFGYKF